MRYLESRLSWSSAQQNAVDKIQGQGAVVGKLALPLGRGWHFQVRARACDGLYIGFYRRMNSKDVEAERWRYLPITSTAL